MGDVAQGTYTVGELRSIIGPLLDKYGMTSASLFGSYARRGADKHSDIDVLLAGKPGFRASRAPDLGGETDGV